MVGGGGGGGEGGGEGEERVEERVEGWPDIRAVYSALASHTPTSGGILIIDSHVCFLLMSVLYSSLYL